MSEAQVIDADAVEEAVAEQVQTSAALIPTVPAQTLAVTPQVEATELKARLDVIREAQEKAMVENTDYGVIPGTNKPTLLKPGAEKLSVLFQLDVQLINEKTFDGDHLTVVSKATVYHAPTGARLGYGEGVCTTKERKYAYRKGQRICPECGAAAIIKGKQEFGGGWLCFNKKGGCGQKWPDGAEVIEKQSVEDVPNPDLPDLWNTVVKMAEKRARVDAVLAVTGASALFTQDIEDMAPPAAAQASEPAGGERAQAQQQSRPPSKAQLGFLERLCKERGFTESTDPKLGQVMAYAQANLTGGKGGSISKLIDQLKGSGEEQTKRADDLGQAVREWAAKQSDLPEPDTEGMEPESHPEDEDIPF